MTKFLVAIALVCAFSVPASAALTGTGPESKPEHRPVQSEQQDRSQTRSSQSSDPYWKPCHITRAGYNSCD